MNAGFWAATVRIAAFPGRGGDRSPASPLGCRLYFCTVPVIHSQFPAEALFVVWLNPFWGSIEHEGKSFEQMKAYTANKARVSAIVRIPALKEDTYGRDLSDMLQERLTFDETLAMDSLTIMTRQRLKIVKGQLFSQLDSAAVL